MARYGGRRSLAVTLSDVARIAGVSPSTVSRVLNDQHLVREDTAEAVRQAVKVTGYTPNLLAGGLASSRSKIVALVVPTIAHSIHSDMVQAITSTLSTAGYQTLLGLSGYGPDQEERLIDAIIGRRSDAVILTGTCRSRVSRTKLLAAGVPVVETWDMSETPIDMLVGFHHASAGRATARHLWAKGYRRFAMISADDQRAKARRSGLVEELGMLGVEDVPVSFVQAPSQLPMGRSGLADLLDRGTAPDVVVCSSDVLAHGALIEAQARGIAVPRDLAIVGFGDLSFAQYIVPSLSTVRVDGEKIGRIAAEAVLARLGGDPAPQIHDVGFGFVDRESA